MAAKDNWKQWRDSAEIDWFSHFIKAWIPFNGWMTYTFGELNDRDLLDNVKNGGNVVSNRIVSMLNPEQDRSSDAARFRSHVDALHCLLQVCAVESRRGRVSFETVDIGANVHKDEKTIKWKREFQVHRDQPTKGEMLLTMTDTHNVVVFTLTQPAYERRSLEDDPNFKKLDPGHRATFLPMYDAVAPRLIRSVLAEQGAKETFKYENTDFIKDAPKIFSALIDVIYSLRNALFHGSITPNEQNNAIYEPAYHIVMRLVRCTI